MLWDIFCRVIDNFGDIGVCWRLSADLAQRGEQVRLWVDDSSALEWMAPGANRGEWPGVQVIPWHVSKQSEMLQSLPTADVWVEAFGCEIRTEFVEFFALRIGSGHAAAHKPVWINLEYLSAESFVERAHALPSPVMQGPAKGWTKHFFYPGFTERTGGLIREPGLEVRQSAFLKGSNRATWLDKHGITPDSTAPATERLISLFCYEPAVLGELLETLAGDTKYRNHLLVTTGRASAAVRVVLGNETQRGSLRISYLPRLQQPEFDELLWLCDLNLVRGEDSLVRALWAGKPFVWQIYPQDDDAHITKLRAFLDRIGASPSVSSLCERWNAVTQSAGATRPLVLPAMAEWELAVQRLKTELMDMPELTGSLLDFVRKNR